MKITIQSLTDIITNSSSETFIIFDESGIEEIKKIVNSILKIADSEYTFDDLFNAELDFNEGEYRDYWEDDGGLEGTGLSLRDYIIQHNQETIDRREGSLWVDGITITAKPNAPVGTEEAAKLLENIGYIFESDTFYC